MKVVSRRRCAQRDARPGRRSAVAGMLVARLDPVFTAAKVKRPRKVYVPKKMPGAARRAIEQGLFLLQHKGPHANSSTSNLGYETDIRAQRARVQPSHECGPSLWRSAGVGSEAFSGCVVHAVVAVAAGQRAARDRARASCRRTGSWW